MSTAKLFCNDISINEYRKLKLEMLRKDFGVGVTGAEEAHLNELQSEIAIDNYCRKILRDHWRC